MAILISIHQDNVPDEWYRVASVTKSRAANHSIEWVRGDDTTPCPPPPRIVAALELVEAVREHLAFEPISAASDAGYVETWKAVRRIMRKIQELDKPEPEPVKDEAGSVISRIEAKCGEMDSDVYDGVKPLITAIAEELEAMKGGGK